jgi:hypothetical protein
VTSKNSELLAKLASVLKNLLTVSVGKMLVPVFKMITLTTTRFSYRAGGMRSYHILQDYDEDEK